MVSWDKGQWSTSTYLDTRHNTRLIHEHARVRGICKQLWTSFSRPNLLPQLGVAGVSPPSYWTGNENIYASPAGAPETRVSHNTCTSFVYPADYFSWCSTRVYHGNKTGGVIKTRIWLWLYLSATVVHIDKRKLLIFIAATWTELPTAYTMSDSQYVTGSAIVSAFCKIS